MPRKVRESSSQPEEGVLYVLPSIVTHAVLDPEKELLDRNELRIKRGKRTLRVESL